MVIANLVHVTNPTITTMAVTPTIPRFLVFLVIVLRLMVFVYDLSIVIWAVGVITCATTGRSWS